MSIQHPYDATKRGVPASLMLDITISNPMKLKSSPMRALVDTGADTTEIPVTLQNRLDLKPHGEAIIRYGNNEPIKKSTYVVNMSFNGFNFEFIEVTTAVRNFILIGRDVLNKLKMCCNGKNQIFTFEDP